MTSRPAPMCTCSTCADGTAPDDVLQALQYLPAVAPALLPELAARRGLQLLAERIDARPEAGQLFAALFGGSPNAVWLDSSLDPAGLAPEAAERSRFSILADDGGRFGQAVRHSSGRTRVSTGQATVTTDGPFFRWLDGVWGRRALRAPEAYPCEFTLGWLGYLGYELKRETGGNDVTAATPDACLIFAGRAVVLDHAEGTAWLLALDAPDAGDWLADGPHGRHRGRVGARGRARLPGPARQRPRNPPPRASPPGTRKPATRRRSPRPSVRSRKETPTRSA